MTRVLLIAPPANARLCQWLGQEVSHLKVVQACYFGDRCRSYIGEHLGLHSVAAFLSDIGCETKVWDAWLRETSLDALIAEVLASRPDALGVTTMDETLDEVAAVFHRLRCAGYEGRIFAGGPLAVLSPEAIRQRCLGIDVMDGDLGCLASMFGSRAANSGHSLFKDRPLPSRDDARLAVRKGFAVGISSSRGCSHGACKFCSPAAVAKRHGYRWESRSCSSVVDEFIRVQDDIEPEWITFADEDFIGDSREGRHRAMAIARALSQQRARTPFMIDCRVDQVEPHLFEALRSAGLRRVFMGVEHNASESLAVLGKGVFASRISSTMDILASLDIEAIPGYITFLPWEGPRAALEALRFYRALKHYDLSKPTSSLRAYDGTPCQGLFSSVATPWYVPILHAAGIYSRHVMLEYLRWKPEQQIVPKEWIDKFAACHFDMVEWMLMSAKPCQDGYQMQTADLEGRAQDAIRCFDSIVAQYQCDTREAMA